MGIKDGVFSWFIQNVIAPSIEIIDKPGFVITSFSEKGKETYLRDIFFEDALFEIIENRIIEKYGNKGKQALYSAGKKFGYIYSSLSNFTRLNETNKSEVESFLYFLSRYITTIYASNASYSADIDKKIAEVKAKNYIVCNKNGKGYIMTSGGVSGIWAYVINDITVEGVQTKCQGRGDDECNLLIRPIRENENVLLDTFVEKNLAEFKFSNEYKKMNLIRKTQFAKNSLKSLLDSHFFSNKDGIMMYKNMRYFHCESNIIYLLEQEISKLPGGENELFAACNEFGKKLQQQYGHTDYQRFISDYFPALGWGDVIATKKEKIEVTSTYYPWTFLSSAAKHTIFRGVLSGFISASTSAIVEFRDFKQTLSDPYTVTIYAT